MSRAFTKAAPALPLFGDAYMADTRHLNLEESGAYLTLMMIAWRSPDCGLPDDDARLAQMLSLSLGKWRKLRPAVMAFWHLDAGRWKQARLTKERAYVEEKSQKSRTSANARWHPQPAENKAGDGCERISERNAPSPSPSPSPEKSKGSATHSLVLKEQFQSVLSAWNEAAVRQGWPAVRGSQGSTPDNIILSSHLARHLSARIREEGVDVVVAAIGRAERAGMICGPDPPAWWTFNTFVSASKFSNLQGGTYDKPLSDNSPKRGGGWGAAYYSDQPAVPL